MQKNTVNKQNRVWEIDFLRVIALLLMIYFHIIFDMNELFGWNVSYSIGINALTGTLAGSLFILLSGISCTFSKSNFKRAIKILIAAIAITIVTHLLGEEMGVKFGILHFMGVSILLYPLFKKMNSLFLIISGIIVILLDPLLINKMILNTNLLFFLGFTGHNFYSSDYYPLIPWFGIFLIGMALGKLFYKERKSLFTFSPGKNPVSFAGRHTLFIYLVHQPIIVLVLYVIELFSS